MWLPRPTSSDETGTRKGLRACYHAPGLGNPRRRTIGFGPELNLFGRRAACMAPHKTQGAVHMLSMAPQTDLR